MKRLSSSPVGEPPPKRYAPRLPSLLHVKRYTVVRPPAEVNAPPAVRPPPVVSEPLVTYAPLVEPSDGRRPALPGEGGWVLWPRRDRRRQSESKRLQQPSDSASESVSRPALGDITRQTVNRATATQKKSARPHAKPKPRARPNVAAAATVPVAAAAAPRPYLAPWWTAKTANLSTHLPCGERSPCQPMAGDRHDKGRNRWSCNEQSVVGPAHNQQPPSRSTPPAVVSALCDTLAASTAAAAATSSNGSAFFRCHRFRVFPTREQRKLLKRWMGVCRWVYNRAADAINNRLIPITLPSFTAALVNNSNYGDDMQWVKAVRSVLRKYAVRDALHAHKSYWAMRPANRHGFHLKYRTARDAVQSLVVGKKMWNHDLSTRSAFASVFGTRVLRGGREYQRATENGLPHDSRLVRDAQHRWFLCVPFRVDRPAPPPSPAEPAPCPRVVAIDPGVRTFLTTYDLSGNVSEWGKSDHQRLHRLSAHIGALTAKARKVPHRQRCHIRKATDRIRRHIHNLVGDVHRKAAAWLCSSFDTIILPEFRTSEMLRRGKRQLRRDAARSMLRWAHYRFRLRLLHKAQVTAGVRVLLVTEEWTSKACGVCGRLHYGLGGSKHYRCPSCGWECDRDVNGARNVMLKTLASSAASIVTLL